MNRARFLVTLMFFLCPSALLQAQSDGQAAFESYTKLAVGGVWVCEVGDAVLEDTYERILDGRFVRLTSKGVEGYPPQTSILGVDPETKQFTWWGFGANGSVSKGTTSQADDHTWVSDWTNQTPGGSVQSKATLSKVDEDTVKFELLEQQVEGDGRGFPATTIWKRKRVAANPLAKVNLVGQWRYVSGQKDGEELGADHFAGQSVEISEKTFTLVSGEKFVMEYEIDNSTSPAAIKFTIVESPFGAGATAAGIVGMEDGKLRVCYAPMGGDAPAEFQAKAGSGHFLFVLEKK